LQLNDITKIYNGEAQTVTLDDVKNNSEWLNDGTFVLPVDEEIFTLNCPVLTNVETDDFTLFITFNDGNGGNNYAIDKNPVTAQFIINPRPVIIKTHDHTWTYDGNAHGCETCVYDNADVSENSQYDILETLGHSLQITYAPTVVNVWDTVSENNQITFKMNDGNDGKNYVITCEYGTLTIDPRPVIVHTHDHEFIYNGQPQNCYDYGCGEDAYDLESPTEDTGLVAGHTMELFLKDSVVNVGDRQDNCGYAYFYNGGTNVTQNYTFSDDCTWGELTVAPREIIIHAHDHEFIYNGQPQNCQDCGISAYELEDRTQDTGLVDGHNLTVIFSNSVTNVGDEASNEFTILIEDNGWDITYNYKLSDLCTYGKLSLAKRAVYFNLDTVQKTYNGEKQYPVEEDISYRLSEDTGYYPIVDGHVVRFFDVSSDGKEDVGTVEFTFRLVIANGNDDVTANYDIQPDNLTGTLEITPRPITVTTDEVVRIYNGKDQTPTAEELNVQGVNLVDGHQLSIVESSLPTMRSAGTQVFNITVVIHKGANINDTDVTSNYSINGGEPVTVTFTIQGREIIIQSHDFTWEYDGTAHDCNGETDTYMVVDSTEDTGLVDGHSLTLNFTGSITNVVDGGVPNTFTYVILDENGEPATDNYVLVENEKTYGTLTLTPRTVRVAETHTHTFTYNGQWQSCKNCDEEYTLSDGSLVNGHKLIVLTATEVMNVADCGENGIENAITFSVADGNGGKNYTVVTDGIVNGILKMNKISVTVEQTCNHEWTYDGDAHSCQIDGGCALTTVPELGFGHYLYIKESTTITDITDDNGVENVVVYGVKSANGNDVSANYDVLVNSYGRLKIKARVLKLKAADYSWDYVGRFPFADVIGTYDILSEPLSGDYEIEVTGAVDEEIVYADESTTHRLTSVKILHKGIDVTENFDLDYSETGTFSIYKRSLDVWAQSEEHVYTGEWFVIDANTYDCFGLVDGHTLTAKTWGVSGLDVGEYMHVIVDGSVVVLDENGNRYGENGKLISENYAIQYSNGSLRITNCEVVITSHSDKKIYDGTPLTNSGYDVVIMNESGALATGHTLYVDVTGTRTDAGISENYFTYVILDENEKDISSQYSVTMNYGELEVTHRSLIISTGSAEKLYDGTPLTSDAWSWSAGEGEEGGLLAWHKILITCTGTRTDAGSSENTFIYTIVDTLDDNAEVWFNYAITEETGELKVLKRTLTFTTGPATKPYDGTPLTSAEYTYVTGLMHEHKLDAERTYTTGSQTEIGRSYNTLTFVVLDADDNDITQNYEFSKDCVFGTLVVTDPKPTVLFYVTTDRDGDVYLREMSYGDYDDKTGAWGIPTLYENSPISPLYYAGLAAAEYGVSSSTVTIEAAEGYEGLLPYMLPYYVSGSEGTAYGDIYVAYDWTDSYTLDYYAYVGRSAVIPAEYAQAEEYYREYVYNNYVDLPQSTKTYMQSIIDMQGWSKDDEDIIDAVASYIKNAATYNLNYDVALESAGDIAVAFLRDYKEGVCRHYASAATAMFRTLGIPARYTEGFYVSAMQGERMEVKVGHAWVEVYIDGMGWVNVEVTGSGVYKPKMTIKPEDFIASSAEYSYYDASERPSDTGIVDAKGTTLSDLLSYGYSYDAVVSGSLYGVGRAEIEILSFTLYNADFDVVTDEFEIVFEKGVIVISEKIVTLSGGAWKYYDGEALVYDSQSWMATVIDEGTTYRNGELVTVSLDLDKLPTLIDAGKLTDDDLHACITVTDQNGVDVTGQYTFDTTNLVFEIRQMTLSIKLGSASKPYDGTVLNSTSYSLKNGSLVSGHTLTIQTTGSNSADIGTYKNELVGFVVTDLSGNDVTSNYKMECSPGKLTITE
jgi:transglutaminase-like putative cysteine protease